MQFNTDCDSKRVIQDSYLNPKQIFKEDKVTEKTLYQRQRNNIKYKLLEIYDTFGCIRIEKSIIKHEIAFKRFFFATYIWEIYREKTEITSKNLDLNNAFSHKFVKT